MARGVNKAIVIGNLGAAPESGNNFTRFSVGSESTWTENQIKKSHTEWFKCVAFGRLAEICNQYLRKGSKVYIEGEFRTNKWNDEAGQTRYTTQVLVKELQLLDRPPQQNVGVGEQAAQNYQQVNLNPGVTSNVSPEGFSSSDIPW